MQRLISSTGNRGVAKSVLFPVEARGYGWAKVFESTIRQDAHFFKHLQRQREIKAFL
jgi:hypothetical protein